MSSHDMRGRVAARPMRLLGASVAVVAALLASGPAQAQVPWTVSLTPTVNPLAIGGCGPVRLTLADPTTKDWPRNPAGNYVSIADFDMSVVGVDPTGVVGEYNGPSIWSACACQGATVGSAATITATYPAQTLAVKKRVPGLAFQATASFIIGKPRGAYEPPACQALKSQTVVATGPAVATGSTVAMPAPATQATPTIGGATSGAVTCTTGQTLAAGRCVNRAVGAACPTGVADGAGSCVAPATVTCTTGQTLAAGRCVTLPSGVAQGTSATGGAATGGAATGTGAAQGVAASGRSAAGGLAPTATQPVANGPVPINPSGFTAKELGPGAIQLSWKPVNGVSYYVVFGPGSSYGGVKVMDTTTYTVTAAPSGLQEWLVASYYDPGPVASPASAFTKVSIQSYGPPQTSTYRVVATGFKVVKEMFDDLLDRDGVHNEVYAAFPMFHFRDGVDYDLIDRDLRRTKVYGEVSKYPNRIRAGSASSTGGLRDGDAFPAIPTLRVGAVNDSGFPFKVWEGSLTDASDFTVICPQLWEWSGGSDNYDVWFTDLVDNAPIMWANGKQWMNWVYTTTIPSGIGLLMGGAALTPPKFTLLGAALLDRPMGIRPTPQNQGIYVPCQPLLLTRRAIEGSLKKIPAGSAQRVSLAVPFVDAASVPAFGSSYILYLDIERVP